MFVPNLGSFYFYILLIAFTTGDNKINSKAFDNVTRNRRQLLGCELPSHPKNGKWFIYDNDNFIKPGDFLAIGKTLVVECNQNYGLRGSKTIFCFDFGWSQPMGQCLKTCSSRFNTSIMSVSCTLNNVPLANCEHAFEGTLSFPRCADFYENSEISKHPVHICQDGAWSHDLPTCEPILFLQTRSWSYKNEYSLAFCKTKTNLAYHYHMCTASVCGLRNFEQPTLIINGDDPTKVEYPWHTAIYNLTSQLLLCSGTLINERLVVTAAHCVSDDKGNVFPKESYGVAAGKYYRDINDPRDLYYQLSLIKKIFIPTRYRGKMQNYGADIAAMLLQKKFELSFNILPICIDWTLKFESKILEPNGTLLGHVCGWGFTAETSSLSMSLQHLAVPPVSRKKCLDEISESFKYLLTDDKLCAGYRNAGVSVCKGDSGGGLTFRFGTRFYLMGVVSTSPQNEETGGCDSDTYSFYTKVSRYTTNFLLNIETQSRFLSMEEARSKQHPNASFTSNETTSTENPMVPQFKKCSMPTMVEHGELLISCTATNCSFMNISSLGSKVFAGTILTLKCDEGYSGTASIVICKRNGQWTYPPVCSKKCSNVVTNEHSFVTCSLKSKPVPCINPPHGTVATFDCLVGYAILGGGDTLNSTCQDGSWDSESPRCGTQCARPTFKKIKKYGHPATEIYYPWHAMLYRGKDQEFVCHALVVSPNVFISAASCIDWSLKSERYVIATGKRFRSLNDSRDIHSHNYSVAQLGWVNNVDTYSQNLKNDFAIFVIKETPDYSAYFQRVCFPYEFNILVSGTSNVSEAYVSGFNKYDELIAQKVSLESLEKCANDSLPSGINPDMLQDKVCVGSNEQGAEKCIRDGGSPLLQFVKGTHYGLGFFSPSLKTDCKNSGYSIFTNATEYIFKAFKK